MDTSRTRSVSVIMDTSRTRSVSVIMDTSRTRSVSVIMCTSLSYSFCVYYNAHFSLSCSSSSREGLKSTIETSVSSGKRGIGFLH